MQHRIKKVKFRGGVGANRMLMKKLVYNFMVFGKIITTKTKAKALKTFLEKLVEKSKEKNEANKNYLFKHLNHAKLVRMFFNTVGPVIKDKIGGYVRLINLGSRLSDGSERTRVEWAYPIVTNEKKSVKNGTSHDLSVQKNLAKGQPAQSAGESTSGRK